MALQTSKGTDITPVLLVWALVVGSIGIMCARRWWRYRSMPLPERDKIETDFKSKYFIRHPAIYLVGAIVALGSIAVVGVVLLVSL